MNAFFIVNLRNLNKFLVLNRMMYTKLLALQMHSSYFYLTDNSGRYRTKCGRKTDHIVKYKVLHLRPKRASLIALSTPEHIFSQLKWVVK